MRNRIICFLMAMLLGGLAGDRFTTADDSVGLAIREYVKAFNAKDADALRNMWAENATYMDHEFAERTDGRDDIMTAIEDVFARPESVMLSGTVDHVRMVTDSVAQVEGKVMVTVGEEDPKGTQFTAILVKSDDRWVIDSMDEFEIPQPSSSDALSQLDWMIGTWRDDSGEVLVRSTVRASDNGAFLIRSFEADDDQGGKTNSTQVIAWDPRQQTIRSWTFNADGSFGDGQWSKSGDQWLIKSTQTLSDGRSASGTYVITMRSEDEFAINLVGHEIEGVPQPSLLSEVIVRREVATTDSVSASE
ncbi:YybH family protein [Rhodopirellula sp. SWK7]|uniref:YybH family protein n=1 Tax=Rhodopirellula sp. SWK7 TaxID=595460 RepID=UPI001181850A|nr:nuclear transport factor 2 family protein [Rhodopirellula sp. SWK7]